MQEKGMTERYKEQAVIIRQEEISYGIFSMWLKTDKIAGQAGPGQFLSIYCHVYPSTHMCLHLSICVDI